VHLKTKPEFYDLVRQIRLDPNAHNTQEYEALRLIREKAYQQVSLTIRDGEIVTMSAEEDIPIKEQKEREKLILDALRSHRFQTLTVKVSDGNVVHLSQARTLKQKKGKKP